MQIIFGEHVEKLQDRFVVLELDTFLVEGNKPLTTWCVVEKISLEEMPLIDTLKKIHQDLIEQYRKQNWHFCKQAIEQLTGKWSGELDSFYEILSQRILELEANPPGADWTGYIPK